MAESIRDWSERQGEMMARTPWGNKPSYGSEFAKRKMAVDASRSAKTKKRKVFWGPFILAAGMFYAASTDESLATYGIIAGVVLVILGIYWSSK